MLLRAEISLRIGNMSMVVLFIRVQMNGANEKHKKSFPLSYEGKAREFYLDLLFKLLRTKNKAYYLPLKEYRRLNHVINPGKCEYPCQA